MRFLRARQRVAHRSDFPADPTISDLCAEGAIDMGITGSDLLQESGAKVDVRLALGVGRCRLAVCVPDDSAIHSAADLDGLRIATSFQR